MLLAHETLLTAKLVLIYARVALPAHEAEIRAVVILKGLAVVQVAEEVAVEAGVEIMIQPALLAAEPQR